MDKVLQRLVYLYAPDQIELATSSNEVKQIIENFKIKKNIIQNPKKIKIPICCDQEYALDLTSLSNKLNISTGSLIVHAWTCKSWLWQKLTNFSFIIFNKIIYIFLKFYLSKSFVNFIG